ncbi:MAG: hypothetical protein ACRYG2_15145 [Janthinobacterium lividum]
MPGVDIPTLKGITTTPSKKEGSAMDERTRQREQDDVDAGMTPQEVLQRTAADEQQRLDHALAELSASHADQEMLDTYGVDMAAMRRGIDLSGGWSLP